MYKPSSMMGHLKVNSKLGQGNDLERAGMYSSCNCGKVYMGVPENSLGIRKREHMQAVQSKDYQKSALVYHTAVESTF